MPEHASGQPHEIGQRLKAVGVPVDHAAAGVAVHGPPTQRRSFTGSGQPRRPAGFGFADDDPAVCWRRRPCCRTCRRRRRRPSATCGRSGGTSSKTTSAIDPASWRSLEIDRTMRTGGTEGSLLSAIDRTRTPMGGAAAPAVVAIPAAGRRTYRGTAGGDRRAGRLAGDARAGVRGDGRHLRHRAESSAASRSAGWGPRDLAGLGRCVASLPGVLWTRWRSCRAAADVAPDLVSMRPFCDAQAKIPPVGDPARPGTAPAGGRRHRQGVRRRNWTD